MAALKGQTGITVLAVILLLTGVGLFAGGKYRQRGGKKEDLAAGTKLTDASWYVLMVTLGLMTIIIIRYNVGRVQTDVTGGAQPLGAYTPSSSPGSM